MSEPSVWWPIPVPASRWFSEDERQDSNRYHEPIERAVVLRTAAQGFGLLAAWWLIERLDPAWWWVVAVVLLALTIPRLIADAWHEFIHEPRFGDVPVARAAFAVTTMGRLVIEGGLLAVGLAVLGEIGDSSWLMLAVVSVAAVMPVLSAIIGPRIVLLTHRATDVPADHDAHRHVAAMAAAHQLRTPRLVELDRASFDGANAYVTGQRSGVTVAVSHRLLTGPDALLRHVVAHEITHLERRHLWWTAASSSASLGATLAGALTITTQLVDGGSRLPVLILTAAACSQPFRLVLAWLSRAHERQADRAAMRHAPVPAELLKQLHLSDRPLLEPGCLARWQSSHPSPAERLEAATRRTRNPIHL